MARFSTIDFSELPAPDVVTALDTEAIIVARKADIVARLADIDPELAAEIEAILALESEPMTKLQEAGAYRETIHYARVNDAARAVLLATATAADLDNLGAYYGVARAEGETDTRFRQRIALAPEALTTAGSAGGYVFQTMGVSLTIKSVGLETPAPGVVNVSFLVDDVANGVPSVDLINAVRTHLMADDIKPLTDELYVAQPAIEEFTVDLQLVLAGGPDPATVLAASEAAVRTYLAKRHAIGHTVYLSGIDAAAHVAGVESVIRLAPVADIVPAVTGAAFATDLVVVAA